jgi:hypothetical protein
MMPNRGAVIICVIYIDKVVSSGNTSVSYTVASYFVSWVTTSIPQVHYSTLSRVMTSQFIVVFASCWNSSLKSTPVSLQVLHSVIQWMCMGVQVSGINYISDVLTWQEWLHHQVHWTLLVLQYPPLVPATCRKIKPTGRRSASWANTSNHSVAW